MDKSKHPTKKALRKARAKARKKYDQAVDDMFLAISKRDLDTLRRALDAGARPTELDAHGNSTLHLALDHISSDDSSGSPLRSSLPQSHQRFSISSLLNTQCEHCFDDEYRGDGSDSNDEWLDCSDDDESWDDEWSDDEDSDLNITVVGGTVWVFGPRGVKVLSGPEKNNWVIIDIVNLLLERGANPNVKSITGKSVLYRVIQIMNEISYYEIASRLLNLLFSYGVTWSYAGKKSKFDPFLLALRRENDEALQLFVEHGYQLDRCHVSTGPSYMWTFVFSMNTFEMLARAGLINVTARDNLGYTALRSIVESDYLIRVDEVKTLIELGAKINAPNRGGLTVMHMAAYKNKRDDDAYSELMRLLVTHGGDLFKGHGFKGPTPMAVVVREGDPDLIAWCFDRAVERGVSMDKMNSIAPLSQAVLSGNEGILQQLLCRAFNIDQINPIYNMTALHIAAKDDRLAHHAKLLLEWGADVDCINSLAETPLHLSCREGTKQCTELLLLYGADINRKTHDDEVALDLALSCKENQEVVRCIIRQIVLEENQNHVVEGQNKLFIKHELRNYYSECQTEISRAQSSYFEGLHTHYDLLADQSLKKHVGNEVLYKALLSDSLHIKFPIYGMRMNDRLIKERQEFVFDKEVRRALDRILGFNYDCYRPIYNCILRYLPRSDLYNLANF